VDDTIAPEEATEAASSVSSSRSSCLPVLCWRCQCHETELIVLAFREKGCCPEKSWFTREQMVQTV